MRQCTRARAGHGEPGRCRESALRSRPCSVELYSHALRPRRYAGVARGFASPRTEDRRRSSEQRLRRYTSRPTLHGKTMSHYHCVVWIDHREAHVIEFNPDEAEASVIHPKSKHEHLHHKRGAVGSGNAPEDHAYYQSVADA